MLLALFRHILLQRCSFNITLILSDRIGLLTSDRVILVCFLVVSAQFE